MFNNILEKYYAFKARRKLIHQYKYLIAVNKLLETYLTKRILQGGSAEFIGSARKNLIDKQNEIKENESFVEFLKSN
jgi:hypothetical protein